LQPRCSGAYVHAMNHTEALRPYSHGIVLAPMAGSTDSAFRRICLRMGATCVVTEMIAAAGISRRSVKTCSLLRHAPEERPLGVQLFGREPAEFLRAAALVSDLGFDFIDINAGCPVKKVVRSGSGAALLRDLPRLLAIVRATVEGTSLPVTVKLRLGWDPAEPVPGDLTTLIAGEGASALAVHGRYRSDMFSGPVRSEEMRRLVLASPLPVIANGDSTSVEAALTLRESTGAQGLLVGRGALGNPWIFRGLASGRPEDAIPAPEEYPAVIMEQLAMMKEHIPAHHAYCILRGHLMQYIRGFRGAAGLRSEVVSVASDDDVMELMKRVAGLVVEEREAEA
jgi:tRNA-dihydrouridine synthase B